MTETYTVLAILMIAAGFAGILLPLLPGVPLIFGGLWLLAWHDGYQHVGLAPLLLLGLLALLGWLADYLASAWTVRKSGASSRAMWGAGLGSVLGVFGGLAGLLLGPLLGALLGERSSGRDWRQAGRAALAAGSGLIVATLAKLLLGCLMLAVFGLAWLW
ncbi:MULTISPECIES: DUF456 domain-containing protein [unclassified Paludibacterium]|uniref:DUF456 domain-containing protein n=1 Tax=unclassified Paludibacterium TaxID=2618429 RepID=UPI001C058A41|nr:DUF456 domain-containing protein [Paludibacterium sp. B53371]BEV72657.1 DUF456 family protein [Paludibacterium sp. THUN1379]